MDKKARVDSQMRFLTLATFVLGSAAAQTISVPAGSNLQIAVNGAPAGATLLVSPGTFALTSTLVVSKSLTIRSTGGPAVTAIQLSPINITAVLINSSNVTLDGFSISGGNWGVYAGDPNGVASFSNIQLKDLVVDTVPNAEQPGHGIFFRHLVASVIDRCVVVKAYANGIFVDQGSTNILVISSTVQQTSTQHAIAVKKSNNVTIAGNTITGSAFHGILLIGSSYCRIENNTISGHQFDGITLTVENMGAPVYSRSNYVGQNVINSNGKAMGRSAGTGIWLNAESNGNLVFGNTITGHAESGISIFNSSNNEITGNWVRDNGQGGIFVYGPHPAPPQSPGNAPVNTLIRRNILQDAAANGNIQTRSSSGNDIAFNAVDGAFGGAGAAGVILQSTSASQVYQNMFKNLPTGAYVFGDTTSTTIFQNRFLNDAFEYSLSPAGVSWDAGPVLGGNYWSTFPSANGNPSNGATPYTGFIGGSYSDRYPFQSPTFGQVWEGEILQPLGQTWAIGASKAISWHAPACAEIDLGSLTGQVAFARPNSGTYQWAIPSTTVAGGTQLILNCYPPSGGELRDRTEQALQGEHPGPYVTRARTTVPGRGGQYDTRGLEPVSDARRCQCPCDAKL